MKIKWLGHASFLVTSDSGVKIITDPYATSENLRYGEINQPADVVTVSHEHGDHNNVAAVKGNPIVVRTTATVKGIDFKGVSTFHDNDGGRTRGRNTVFCFAVDGVKVCHLGDLGHPLNDAQAAEIGSVDVLLIPVGGNYTCDAVVATRVGDKLKPKVIIPMHYQTEKLSFPIADCEPFVKGKANVRRLDASEVSFEKGKLPAKTEIDILKPEL
jgi:L-ascorbate metabolism protein UlaG (beta-lactamase superfamily)